MITTAELRRLALSLPETEEKAHFGKPDFRVCNKIFAGLSTDGAIANVKLSAEIQADLLSSHAHAFSPAEGAWGRAGWTYMQLAGIDQGVAQALLAEGWRLVAPKRLVASYDKGQVGGARPARPKR